MEKTKIKIKKVEPTKGCSYCGEITKCESCGKKLCAERLPICNIYGYYRIQVDKIYCHKCWNDKFGKQIHWMEN